MNLVATIGAALTAGVYYYIADDKRFSFWQRVAFGVAAGVAAGVAIALAGW